ncbi:MAG: hypothetical protein ABIC40_07555 [bacterium]
MKPACKGAEIVFLLALIAASCSCAKGINNPPGWPVIIGGPNAFCNPSQIAADSKGNVYISGVWNGSVDFDPGPGKDIGFSREISSFIVKFDREAKLEWCKRFPQYPRDLVFKGMCCDSSGTLYACGTRSAPSGDLAILMAYDSDGELKWQQEWVDDSDTGDGCQANAITVDSSDNLYIGGNFNGDVHFGPENEGLSVTTSIRGHYAYTCKLDNNGEIVWMRNWQGAWKEDVSSIAIAQDGSIYVTGICDISDDLIFDTGEKFKCPPPAGLVGWYLLKLEADGQVKWIRFWRSARNDWGCTSRKVIVSGNSQVFVAGDFRDEMRTAFGDTIQSYKPNGGKNVFLFSLDSSGSLLWGHTWEGKSWDYAKTLFIDPSGQIRCGGTFKGSVDFDPGPGERVVETISQGEQEPISSLSTKGDQILEVRPIPLRKN